MTAYSKTCFYDRVIARQSEMESDRSIWDAQRQDIVEYYRPDLTVYSDSSAETGSFVHEAMVEGTGAWAAGVMARGFQSAMVGPSLKWFRHLMSRMRLRGVDRINAWLQRFDDYMREGVYRPSNYYELMGQNVLDGISIGSPVMLMQEVVGKGFIHFKLPHYMQNYLMRDDWGEDIAYHGKWELSNLSAMRHFGKENLPPTIQQELESGNHKTKHKYLHVIYEVGDPILYDFEDDSDQWQKPKGSNIMYRPVIMRRWCQYYFCMDSTDIGYKGALPAGIPGFDYKPFSAWHYWRNSHETYARTPSWYGIYDEKGGQGAWTTMYEAAHRAGDPPMLLLAAMKARARIRPGGRTYAQDDNEYDRPPKEIITSARYPHAIDFVDRIDDKRQRHFHVDLFRMLDRYHQEHKQPPTAFEIAQMIAEKNAQIGPAIESFDRGLLSPVDQRLMEIEARSGRLFNQTEPPEELMGMTLDDLMPMFTGPLAQAQKIAVTMRKIMDPLSMAAPVFEQWPDAKYKIKGDVLVEKLLEDLDFYQEAIATEEEYDAIMDALTRQRAKERALQEASVVADMVPKFQKGGETAKMITGE